MTITGIINELRETGLNLEQSKLVDRLAEIEKGCIVWSIEDFLSLNDAQDNIKNGIQITPENAKLALTAMVNNHDSDYGVSWDNVKDYFYEYATKDTETII